MLQLMKKILDEAHSKINEADFLKEQGSLGTMRAGSSGAIVGNSHFYTQCGRLAQARLLGIQSEPTKEMRLMFNGGLTLEDFLEVRFKTLGIEFYKEKTVEREIEGVGRISGRPDFMVRLEGELIGVEVKSLASPFSVIKQRKNGFPFLKHLIQAATYLLITQADRWLICIGHSFYVNQNGKKHDPDLLWYELKVEEGKLVVYNKNELKKYLPFDFSNIRSYYQELSSKTAQHKLMGRPTEFELNVDTYNRCNYCHMKSACNEYDVDQISFESWLERIKITKDT